MRHLKHRRNKLAAIVCGIIGSVLKFLAERRTDSIFDGDGLKLQIDPQLSGWFWAHCGQLGFVFLLAAFLLYACDHFTEAHRATK